MVQNDLKVGELKNQKCLQSLDYDISAKVTLHIWIPDINPNTFIYYTYRSELYKNLKTCCQVMDKNMLQNIYTQLSNDE